MILGDCRQLKTDLDSFNENRGESAPIQISFDFTNDLLELEALHALGLLRSSEPADEMSANERLVSLVK